MYNPIELICLSLSDCQGTYTTNFLKMLFWKCHTIFFLTNIQDKSYEEWFGNGNSIKSYVLKKLRKNHFLEVWWIRTQNLSHSSAKAIEDSTLYREIEIALERSNKGITLLHKGFTRFSYCFCKYSSLYHLKHSSPLAFRLC